VTTDPLNRPKHNRAEDIALFRYAIVREAVDETISKSKRGQLVRELASMTHIGIDKVPVVVSRQSIDRWIRSYRKGGFAALHPSTRHVEPRTPEHLLELACDLRKEDPFRTAAHIAEIIRTQNGWSPHERTLQRHFKALGLSRAQLSGQNIAFGRFEAEYPNELWVGDALHGPIIGGKKAILFCFCDDHSRLVTAHRWTYSEDTLSAQAALRRGILSRGIPGTVYLDNGSPFVSRQLLRALAVLGIRLVHSKPRRPMGRGKIERFFRTVREQFLIEVAHSDISLLEVLEERFQAWVEQVYHRRIHSETGQTPLERFSIVPKIPDLSLVREAFLFSESRTVTKTAMVSLYGNDYEVDQALIGRKVDLVFDPFDLSVINVRYMDRDFGKAVIHKISRHSHPMVISQPPETIKPSGIDYLSLIDQKHRKYLGSPIGYRELNKEEEK
jgi:putative transposase